MLIEGVHRRTLKGRSIQTIVESEKFERLWLMSDEDTRKEVEKIIGEESKYALTMWMKNHPSVDLGERPLEYLRQQGKKLRVKNYSRLSKPELIRGIQEREQDYEQKQSGDAITDHDND